MTTEVFTPTLYHYAAQLVYVVDGDTADLIVDYGNRIKRKERLRFYDIDTPEVGKVGYQEAKAFVQSLMDKYPYVMIRTHLDHADKYGRLLAEIFFLSPDGYLRLNDLLQPFSKANVAATGVPDPLPVIV